MYPVDPYKYTSAYSIMNMPTLPFGTYYFQATQGPAYFQSLGQEYKGNPHSCKKCKKPMSKEEWEDTKKVIKDIQHEHPEFLNMLILSGFPPVLASQYLENIIAVTLRHSK